MEHARVFREPRHSGEIAPGYEGLAHQNDNGFYELSVHVGGVHCAACIQKIESSLLHDDHIRNARLNFSTHRLSFEWQGRPEKADDYVRTVEALGYEVQPYDLEATKDAAVKEGRFLLLCMGVAGFAMGNVMLLSVGLWSTSSETMGIATREFMHWIAAFIALPAILFAARPFFRSALGALAKGRTNMDVPISLALILAGGMSLFETINGGEHVYFDSAVMLMFFLLVGRYLDFRARLNARSVATGLMSSLQGFATIIESDKPKRILIRDLKEGMIIRVATGEKFPADGVLQSGKAEIDTALITGETLPKHITAGEPVYAGTINMGAAVTMTAQKTAEDTLLADIVRLMEKAEQGQAKYVRLADKAAQAYTPVIHACAFLAFIAWWLVIGVAWQHALMIAITVLIITCPCALGLAVPVVQVLASARLMKQGILVKSGDALERLAQVDTVLTDKTGTLTHGDLKLIKTPDKKMLQRAASLAAHSQHPLSCAIYNHFTAHCDDQIFEIDDLKEIAGQGLQGRYKNKAIKLGNAEFCEVHTKTAQHDIILWLALEGQEPYAFTFTDTLKTDAYETIRTLKNEGYNIMMLTGDRDAVARDIGKKVGIDLVYAAQNPAQKYKILEADQADGQKVLMIGDGLNDAPVLAAADVSMAPGTAIDLSQKAADIVFMGDKLQPVAQALKTARFAQILVKQNFTLALLYNLFAIPLALGGFVTPLIAALCMSGSSLIVIANSFRLKWMA